MSERNTEERAAPNVTSSQGAGTLSSPHQLPQGERDAKRSGGQSAVFPSTSRTWRKPLSEAQRVEIKAFIAEHPKESPMMCWNDNDQIKLVFAGVDQERSTTRTGAPASNPIPE